MKTPARLAATLAVAALFLTGCTGDDEPGPDQTAMPSGDAGTGEVDGDQNDPGTATVADQVMAEQTVATPHGGGEPHGGDVTVTLRSMEVDGGTMTVRWALRWDDDEAPADDGVTYSDLGVTPAASVVDGANLTSYRPLCTDGSWKDVGGPLIYCTNSMLVSPSNTGSFEFPNHGTIEAWAVLPAPEGRPESVDVAPAEGLPMFTDATVTYTDDGQE